MIAGRGRRFAGVMGIFACCLANASSADEKKPPYGVFRIRSDVKVTADVPSLFGRKHKKDSYVEPGVITLVQRSDADLDIVITVRGYTCTVHATPAGAASATVVPKTCVSDEHSADLKSGSITWHGDEITLTTAWASTLAGATAAITATSTGKLKDNVPACYSSTEYFQCMKSCAKKDGGCRDGCNGKKNFAVDHHCFDP